jgi:3-oxoacyl-[acyl-carrier protein] reductase
MDLRLNDKNAIVCGSTQGIGFAVAQQLASMGANITLLARNEDKLKARVSELAKTDSQHHGYIVADYSSPDSLQKKVREFVSGSGPIHILVNNTGGPPGGLVSMAKTVEFTDAFSKHLVCNHILATAVIPGMKAAGYGRIVNVISTSVKQPLNGLGVSNTVRGAVANWAKTLANELGVHNITVNNVLPGATNTARLSSIVSNKATKTGRSEEEVKSEMANAVPMKRVAEPHEVANAVAFLASPAASYINGINLPVDGGRTGSL